MPEPFVCFHLSSESQQVQQTRSEIVQKVGREIKVYTEADHLSGLPNETIELYQALKERVLALGDNIEVRPRKLYIGFTIFCIIVRDSAMDKK